MQNYLDDETKAAIEAKLHRYENEIKGKVIAHAVYSSPICAMSFTDGTWFGVEGSSDYEGDTIDRVWGISQLNLYDLRDLALITDEQFKAASKRKDDEERKRKEEKIRQLQAELE